LAPATHAQAADLSASTRVELSRGALAAAELLADSFSYVRACKRSLFFPSTSDSCWSLYLSVACVVCSSTAEISLIRGWLRSCSKLSTMN
jgi:hypothetical protein